MTIFAILFPAPQPALEASIRAAFPNDHLNITDTQWLVSDFGTAIDVAAKVGIADPKNPQAEKKGNGIVFATTSYYGRAPTPVWDWIKAKLEAPSNG